MKSLGKVTYSRVEESTTDTEEHPDVDRKGGSECQRDIQQRFDVHAPATKEVIGSLRCCERKEQE